MATRRLADVYTPEEFDRATLLESTTKMRIIQSGLVVIDNLLQDYANSQSNTGTLPVDDDLGNDEPNIQSDDPAQESTPLKTGSRQAKWIKNFWHQSWSAMTLARELHHSVNDPLDLIIGRVNRYWDRNGQRFLTSMLAGITADNIASDGEDMVLDISTDQVSPDETNYLDGSKIIESEATMGDSIGEISMIFMHSAVYTRLRQLELIDFESPSAQNTLFGMYQNKEVVVDDGVNTDVDANSNVVYDTYLTGRGLFGLGVGTPIVPSEVDREPAKGNGGGEDILHSRRNDIIHPYGFSFEGAPAGISPSRAEYEVAASWSRIVDRQHVPLVIIRHNNAFV